MRRDATGHFSKRPATQVDKKKQKKFFFFPFWWKGELIRLKRHIFFMLVFFCFTVGVFSRIKIQMIPDEDIIYIRGEEQTEKN